MAIIIPRARAVPISRSVLREAVAAEFFAALGASEAEVEAASEANESSPDTSKTETED